ncbi:trypsin-like serine peptidase, partial [Microtetraspora fusca]|uniref:trypsin-like serine peptidase n=1 Tax=Microtetraspora fusca TaxID=1997 RepID=UPI00082BA7A6
MKRTLAFGGLVATAGLLAAGLAAPAQATNTVSSDTLANTNLAAKQVAAFWYGQAKANLLNATPYGVETKIVAKHVSKGGPAADSKPGVVPAIGDEKKAAAKSKNVNLPKTVGKVFFIGADKQPHWCSATSLQSNYRNLVATAGHCVYDTGKNAATMDKWVFIPGYYQGKTPWGIYVGKQAFTHYDFDVYEDGDRDYAFVTVYNGVLPESAKADKEYKSEVFATQAEAEAAKAKLQADKSTAWSELSVVPVPGDNTQKPATVADFQALNKDKDLTGNGPWAEGTGASDPVEVSKYEYKFDKDSYVSRDGKTLYFRTKVDGKPGHGHHQQKPEYKYFKRTFWTKAAGGYQVVGKTFQIGLKDVGRLGDNVGGQGMAYNQKLGKNVFVFGYPSGTHPDGN